ncbi:MAG: hypothetical protein AUG13_00270 [Chloroflexi bacterium 13_1_20CM_2_59_7]|nr:MAG: hypothetical protein AUG13_00270 [Chloroflexi bacterium 13_1_20CM_2_59_7]
MGTALIILLILLGSVPSATQARVTIAATVGPGFFAFDLMNGFAPMISRSLPNVTAVAERSPLFLDTMQRIAAGRADLGIVGSVIVVDAFLGEEVFRGSRVPVRTLALLHDFVYHLVTLEETGIGAIGDLRGKRVGIDAPGTVRDALRWLRAAGIDPDQDVRMETFPLTTPGAWAVALREKKIDAVFAVTLGSPTVPDVFDLTMTSGIRVRLIPLDAILPAVQREFGSRYHAFMIKRGLYPGMTSDVPTISASAELVALEAFDANLAYQITKLFYEKRSELAQFSYAAQYISLIGLAGRSPVPFHPGAVRYFQERGVAGF